MTILANRYDFVFLFDVANGNPNGDPDAGNMPRLDPETNQGLVTDVCLKRKIRNYAEMARNEQPGFRIYMKDKSVLNNQNKEAYTALGIPPVSKKLPKEEQKAHELTQWMCANFFDVRTFGAVMTTEVNTGQVRGPVQMTFSRSIEAVVPLEISITRSSVTNAADVEKERTMGRKHIIPYGLYRAHGFISAKLAEKTGFSDGDLSFLWEALENMFEHDRSAARGEMAARKLIVFKHDCALGKAPAHALFDRVSVKRKFGGDSYDVQDARLDNAPPARAFTDYDIVINEAAMPDGVEVIQRL